MEQFSQGTDRDQAGTGQPRPSSTLTLRQGGSSANYVPSPNSRCYREYMITGILLDAIAEANNGRDPSSPRLVNAGFQWDEFFGTHWYYAKAGSTNAPQAILAQGWQGIVQVGVATYGDSFAAAQQAVEQFLENDAAQRRRTELASYIPYSPLREHDRYRESGRDWSEIIEEKERNYAEMLRLADPFSGSSRALIEAAAKVALDCHFNHFRGGPGTPHYSIHLLKVAQRVTQALDAIPGELPTILDADGAPIDPRAIAIALALTHDTIEDFHENFKNKAHFRYPPDDYHEVARRHLIDTLTKAVGSEAANALAVMVQTLSHHGDDQFPSRAFLGRALGNRVTHAVRLADIEHNLSTFPTYAPAWASVVAPAQYLPLARGTPFEESFHRHILESVAEVHTDEILPWVEKPGARALDSALEDLRRNEGAEAVERVRAWHARVQRELAGDEGEDPPCSPEVPSSNLVAGIRLMGEALGRSAAPHASADTPDIQLTSTTIGGIGVRILGPVVAWTGELALRGDPNWAVQDEVVGSATKLNRRISGYLMTEEDGQLRYRISRVPRRATAVVPSIAEYRDTLRTLCAATSTEHRPASVREEEVAQRPLLRAVFGLEEGYLEQRRREVLEVIGVTIKDLPTARALVLDRMGDLSKYGVDLQRFESVRDLRHYLRRESFRRTHHVSEAEEHFAGKGVKVIPMTILAASPGESGSPAREYSESGFVVELSGPSALAQLVAWADKTRQARFSLEHLSAGESFTIELSRWCMDRAAQVT